MIKTFASYTQIENPHILTGHLAIVIDVLRATSTMITALNNGASYIYPVASVASAIALKRYHTQALLGGEHNMDKIEGFDYSNSPLDYSMHHIYNKQLIFTTTNGTKAMQRCNSATDCTIAALLNASAVVDYCRKSPLPIAIVMSGTEGRFSIEDALCAGAITFSLAPLHQLDDLGQVCADIFIKYHENKNYYSCLSGGQHGKNMAKNGLRDDIEYCSQYNIYDIIPLYREGVLSI